MATQTPNIGLIKPIGTEKYDLAVVNGNSDIIDSEITDAKAGSATRIFKCKNDVSSNDNALNVQAGDGRYIKISTALTSFLDLTYTHATDAVAKFNQLGAGIIAEFKTGGIRKAHVANNGDIFSKGIRLANTDELDAVEANITANAVAVGTVIDFAGDTAPAGYLACNGGVVSTTTYAGLYAVLGVLWANTAGASTPLAGEFRLPPQQVDGLGLYVRGVGATNGIVGTYQTDSFKSHVHDASHNHTGYSGSAGNHRHHSNIPKGYYANSLDGHAGSYASSPLVARYTEYAGAHTHTITINTKSMNTLATGDATETRPRSITMLKCIKY